MRLFKNILKYLLLLLVILIISGGLYYNHLKPNYSGELELYNLSSETTVYFDDYGIPHIYAENQVDAATVLGYVHAQDRLWQMEVIRRISPGRLSEIFGEVMLKNDKLFVCLGIDEASEKTIKDLDKNSAAYKIMVAYLDGVNQFIDNGPTPLEYILVGVEKEHFTIKDIYNTVGYMSFSFAMAQKTDPMLSVINEKLGIEYIKELNIDINPNTTLIKNSKEDVGTFTNLMASVDEILNNSPIPPFIGSNSWVVAAEKTSTGNVIFANDPHIAYSQPSVWFEAHIVTPSYEMYGYHLAGVPFPFLGHNRSYAYGLTMFENDDIDFYKEQNHPTDPTKYKTPSGYEDYTSISKTIKVKDSDDIIIKIKSTRHGPIINGVIDGLSNSNPIAMFWIYTKMENKVAEAVFILSNANSMEEFKKGVSKIHAPGLNIMYGDAKGNIAWWAAAKLYKHKAHVNTKFILDGASGEDDITEYLAFSENPMSENPPWNYVYSANNQPDSIAGMLYPGYYLPEDRAKRIVELLEPKNNWNIVTMSNMINDVTSAVSSDVIKEFTNIMDFNSFGKNEQRAIDILQLWDGSNTIDAITPTIYNKWVYLYLKNTFEDELGPELFAQFNKTHLIKRVIADQISKNESIWWDDISTSKKIETKKDILSLSLIEAVSDLENQLGVDIKNWTWGKVHTLEHNHPLGKVASLRSYFNVGPFPIKGAREVIDNRSYQFNDSGIYHVKAGPSTRRIIDFSDVENSISILPTGQSGNAFSKYYRDQAEMYNKGEFRKMKMNKEKITEVSSKLIFSPAN